MQSQRLAQDGDGVYLHVWEFARTRTEKQLRSIWNRIRQWNGGGGCGALVAVQDVAAGTQRRYEVLM